MNPITITGYLFGIELLSETNFKKTERNKLKLFLVVWI